MNVDRLLLGLQELLKFLTKHKEISEGNWQTLNQWSASFRQAYEGNGAEEFFMVWGATEKWFNDYFSALNELIQWLENRISNLEKFANSSGIDFGNISGIQEKPSSLSKKILSGRGSLRERLDKLEQPSVPKDLEAHHLIPVDIINRSGPDGIAIRAAIEEGFDFNGPVNGMFLAKFNKIIKNDNQGIFADSQNGIHANHPRYTDKIGESLAFYHKKLENAEPPLEKPAKLAAEIVANLAREMIKMYQEPTYDKIIVNLMFDKLYSHLDSKKKK